MESVKTFLRGRSDAQLEWTSRDRIENELVRCYKQPLLRGRKAQTCFAGDSRQLDGYEFMEMLCAHISLGDESV